MLQIRTEPPSKKIKDMNLTELTRELQRCNYYIGSCTERGQLSEAVELGKLASKIVARIAEKEQEVTYYGKGND